MKGFLSRWLVLTFAVFVAANLRFVGISYDSWTALIVAALVLGLANTWVKPVLLLISLPLVIFSLGFFVWIINALLLYGVGHLVDGFHVGSFGSAMAGALVISVVNLLFGAKRAQVEVRRPAPPPRNPPPGDGPIIDI